MRRLAMIAFLILPAAPRALPQEPAAAKQEKAEEASPGWLWANFVILAAGLAWVFKKNATPYFVSRALRIRKEILEAEDAGAEAERHRARVDARLAHLAADIQALRDEAAAEQKAEAERARQETAAALAKIRAHAEQEIAAAAKAARLELKRYSAELALGLAGDKIRARMTPEEHAALFHGFVYHLRHPASRAQFT